MNWANRLTLSRLLLTIIFVAALNSSWQYGRTLALFIFLLAGVSDFVDGEIARRYGFVTDFGKLMDPLVDKIMVAAAFISLVPLKAVPAWAAIEGLYRSLSVECGQYGVRAVCLLTTGIPETSLIDEVFDIHGKAHGITFDQFQSVMEGMTHTRRLTTLAELTNAAVFVASDEGSAITGTILNLTAGIIVE